MKEFSGKECYVSRLKDIFTSSSNISETLELLERAYTDLNQAIPNAVPFKISLVTTESLKYTVFYQGSSDMSEQSIEIVHAGYDAYLWTDCESWCLDDYQWNIDDIVNELLKAPVFNKIPENVRELKQLLDDGIWELGRVELPHFSNSMPDDTSELVSWDTNYVLTGTKLENLEIVKRSDWDLLCQRENYWFENGNREK